MFQFSIESLGIASVAIICGLGLLLFAGDILVRGSVALALRFRIPPLVIGLTIVAFGTSAPELFIGVQSVFSGKAGLAIGNVVGSNIANILLVLGVPSLIYPTACTQHSIRRNILAMIGGSVLFIFMAWDGRLDFANGVVFLFLIALYLAYWANRAAKAPGQDAYADELSDIDAISGLPSLGWSIVAFIVLGLIGLPIGAQLMVDGGVYVAEYAGVDESLIGLSLIAIGTSLPELATTVVSAIRRHSALAIGNVIGSNLFNLFAVMGVTTLVAGERGIKVPEHLLAFDLWVMLGSAALLIPFAFLHKSITRTWGIIFLAAYVLYIYFIFNFGHTVG
jgi:cation:H+ antiporter